MSLIHLKIVIFFIILLISSCNVCSGGAQSAEWTQSFEQPPTEPILSMDLWKKSFDVYMNRNRKNVFPNEEEAKAKASSSGKEVLSKHSPRAIAASKDDIVRVRT